LTGKGRIKDDFERGFIARSVPEEGGDLIRRVCEDLKEKKKTDPQRDSSVVGGESHGRKRPKEFKDSDVISARGKELVSDGGIRACARKKVSNQGGGKPSLK